MIWVHPEWFWALLLLPLLVLLYIRYNKRHQAQLSLSAYRLLPKGSGWRSYLTEGLGLEIDELTARELAQLLQKAPYEVPQSALAQWVIHSEWVRFADTWAEPAWQAEDATTIYEVVHQLASRKEGKSL